MHSSYAVAAAIVMLALHCCGCCSCCAHYGLLFLLLLLSWMVLLMLIVLLQFAGAPFVACTNVATALATAEVSVCAVECISAVQAEAERTSCCLCCCSALFMPNNSTMALYTCVCVCMCWLSCASNKICTASVVVYVANNVVVIAHIIMQANK